jgi:hypothetical protein
VSSQRLPRLTRALYGMVMLAGSIIAGVDNLDVPELSNTLAVLTEDCPTPLAASNAQTTDSFAPDEGTTTEPMPTAGSDDSDTVETTMLPPESAPLRMATLETPDPIRTDKEAMNSIGSVDECLGSEVCIDEYLWSLYQRTPKRDAIKVVEQRKIKVIKNGKPRTVAQTLTKLVPEDFTWKDPKAAEKAGMSLMEYVIDGMDHTFKLKLYTALRAADNAGLGPGITSAFRDDYRQSLASGLKAATDRSYHGGSFRGGYGHGLAADIISVSGDTDAQRWMARDKLWNWIDAHPEFGIGRPYLDKDPAHVAPIDGKEYADHRKSNFAKRLVAKVSNTLLNRRTVTSGGQQPLSISQFLWLRQLAPAAFSAVHIPAVSIDAKGPTVAR